MSVVKLSGNPVTLKGHIPAKGEHVNNFHLVKHNLKDCSLEEFKGKRVVLNIFPSLDTSVCGTSVRKFNTMANDMDNTVVLAISKDLPFAMERFCTVEGLENVIPLSAFRNHSFGPDFGVEILDGPLQGLLARAVVVLDENHNVVYTQLVPEITEEPDYTAVLEALS